MDRDQALERVRAATRRRRDEIDRIRIAEFDAIRDALAAGVRQTELVAATGWTREHIRRIGKSPHGTSPPRR